MLLQNAAGESSVTESIDIQGLVREINETLILAVLRDGARHGYQIALDVEEQTEGMFSFQHGTLYPILHRLEKDGEIRGEWTKGEGRRRKEYHPTPRGLRELAARGERLRAVFGTLVRLLEEDA